MGNGASEGWREQGHRSPFLPLPPLSRTFVLGQVHSLAPFMCVRTSKLLLSLTHTLVREPVCFFELQTQRERNRSTFWVELFCCLVMAEFWQHKAGSGKDRANMDINSTLSGRQAGPAPGALSLHTRAVNHWIGTPTGYRFNGFHIIGFFHHCFVLFF